MAGIHESNFEIICDKCLQKKWQNDFIKRYETNAGNNDLKIQYLLNELELKKKENLELRTALQRQIKE